MEMITTTLGRYAWSSSMVQFSEVLSTQVPSAATRGHCNQALSPFQLLFLLLLLLLCGIPYSKLIKTRQQIAAADKKGREHTPQGSQILKHLLSI